MTMEDARERHLLSQKDLQHRWNCTIRTVQRERKRFNLKPVDFGGQTPLFTLKAVKEAERKRHEYKTAQNLRLNAGPQRAKAHARGILTIQQLRQLKRKAAK